MSIVYTSEGSPEGVRALGESAMPGHVRDRRRASPTARPPPRKITVIRWPSRGRYISYHTDKNRYFWRFFLHLGGHLWGKWAPCLILWESESRRDGGVGRPDGIENDFHVHPKSYTLHCSLRRSRISRFEEKQRRFCLDSHPVLEVKEIS